MYPVERFIDTREERYHKSDTEYLSSGEDARAQVREPLEPVGAINNRRQIPRSSFTRAIINFASFSL